MKEAWKPIVGFEHLYEVSSLGRVKSLRRGRVMKTPPDAYGYLQVGLYPDDGRIKQTAKVHRLVAAAFLGKQPPDMPEVDHKNRRRNDARKTNLRWSDIPSNRLPMRSKGRNKVVGVSFRAGKPKPWRAYHAIGGRMQSLGHYKTKREAVAARRKFNEEKGLYRV